MTLNYSALNLTLDNCTFLPYYIHSAGMAVSYILSYLLVLLLCVVGNGLVCLVVIRNRNMRSVTNLFILNLAISDLLVGVFCVPTTLIDSLISGRWVIIIIIKIIFINVTINIIITVVIAFMSKKSDNPMILADIFILISSWNANMERLLYILISSSCENPVLDFSTGWPFSQITCTMSNLIQGMSVSASVFTLVAIAVDR